MTKFGRPKRKVDIELGDENGIFDYISEGFFGEIALRNDKGIIYWSTPSINNYYSDDTRVYALNNSHQGIYTIGDIKKNIETQNTKS
jgi:hypothetical protein